MQLQHDEGPETLRRLGGPASREETDHTLRSKLGSRLDEIGGFRWAYYGYVVYPVSYFRFASDAGAQPQSRSVNGKPLKEARNLDVLLRRQCTNTCWWWYLGWEP